MLQPRPDYVQDGVEAQNDVGVSQSLPPLHGKHVCIAGANGHHCDGAACLSAVIRNYKDLLISAWAIFLLKQKIPGSTAAGDGWTEDLTPDINGPFC